MASQLSSYSLAVLPIGARANLASLPPMFDLKQRYKHYAARMREFMDARNITGEIGAELIGAHPTTVYDLRRGARQLDDEWRVKVAAGFKIDHDLLFGTSPLPSPSAAEIFRPKRRGRKPKAKAANDNLPLFGLAAGSLAGSEAMTTDPINHVPCPPALIHVIGAYALQTHGESMIPRYFPREVLYVNPHQQIRSGDHVIIQTQRYDGAGTETWVKRFDGSDSAKIYAWQYNPPAKVEFERKHVIHVHRVLPINELFGPI